MLGLTCLSVEAAVLKHYYTFNKKSLKDSRGNGADLIIPVRLQQNLRNDGYYFLRPFDWPNTDLAFPGPALSSQVLSSDNYAIEIRVKLNSSSLVWWHKLIDPWNLDPEDNGLYLFDGKLTYYHRGLPDFGISGLDVIAPDTFVNILITRDANSNLFRAYLNGILQFEMPDPEGWAVFKRGLIWFFTDDYATYGGELVEGFVDWIKIYDGPFVPLYTP
jgi:hypothetical protein